MKPLLSDDKADVQMIGGVIGILITLIISILIVYNIAGGIDMETADENIMENVYNAATDHGTHWRDHDNITFAANSTDDILDQSATFFAIAPIIAIVVVAVVILKYVGQI